MARIRGVPTAITTAPLRTVRPVMLEQTYANPRKELSRMQDNGVIVKIAPGTYTAKPDTIPAGIAWRPDLEDAAMAYATAQYGDRVPILYGIGAARFHHAIPRAIGATVIAVPEQHRPVELAGGGRIVFTTTDTDKLAARYERGTLGGYMVTTPEQSLVDLLRRPALGGMPAAANEAIEALVASVDPELARELARGRTRSFQARLARLLDMRPC